MKTIIKAPVITEKALKLVETENKYTFWVVKNANKIEVSKAVGEQFKVKVLGVTIINQLGKTKYSMKTRQVNRQENYKKAIVSIKTGDKITGFEIK